METEVTKERFEHVLSTILAHEPGYSQNIMPKIARIELKDRNGNVFETVDVKPHTVVIDGTDEMPLVNYLGY